MTSGPSCRILDVRFSLAVIAFGCSAMTASSQFMRLGPFDITADTSIAAIYSTNVEGEYGDRQEGELEREDYYLLWSLDLNMTGPTTPSSDLNLSTGMSIEKHFVRDDLDNVSDPFGKILLTHDLTLGRFELPTVVQFTRENTQNADGSSRIYIPGQRKDRIVQDTRSYSQGLRWQRDPFSFDMLYNYTEIRYLDDEFKDGDENQHSFNFGSTWDMIRLSREPRLSSFYTYSRDRTDLVGRPDGAGSGEWKETQAVGLRVKILTRPLFTYALAYEKDDDEDWRVTHTWAIQDEWELSPTFIVDANATYKIDEGAREDDITFIYSAGVAHDIGRTLQHSLRYTREPVDTFGSTSDTDSTRLAYRISKTDLFFANLTAVGQVTHTTDKPQGPDAGPEEETTEYSFALTHSAALSRRLTRSFDYLYLYETSSLEGDLEEHRVTFTLAFTL